MKTIYIFLSIFLLSFLSVGAAESSLEPDHKATTTLTTGISIEPAGSVINGDTVICATVGDIIQFNSVTPTTTDPTGCFLSNFYLDSNGDGVLQQGSDILLNGPAASGFLTLTNNPPFGQFVAAGVHTVFFEDCLGVVSATILLVEIPTVEFNNQPGDLFCATGTSVNLLNLLTPNSTMGGTFSLISSPGATATIIGNTLELDINGDYSIRYTITDPFQCSANDDFDLTLNIVQAPIAEFNNPSEDILCTTSTSANLLSFLRPSSTSGGTFTLVSLPGGAGTIDGNTLEFDGDGAYTINYEITDQSGCTANADLTINYSQTPSPQLALSEIGGCITEDAVIAVTRTTLDAGGSTPSWTVAGANFSGGTGMNSTNIQVTVPLPVGDGVPVIVEICLTETTPNCDTETCRALSFFNDGQDCNLLCNGIFFDPCPIDDQPGIVIGCSFFTIETPALVTICSTAENLAGNNILNALQDDGTINCNGASISCGDDGFIFDSEIKLFGLNSDVGGDDTIGDLIGNGLCGVLDFFGIIDDCDATIVQFIVNLLSRLAGGDGAGSLLVADTDGDGQFDTILGDEQNLPVEYTQIFIPNNVEGVGFLTMRSIGSFPNPPAGSCGNIQDAVNLLDLLAPIIDLIPVAGPIINAVIANAGCGADIAVSASDDFVVCVENDQPPFFVNCPTVPYMFSQDFSCNINANWSIPIANDLCSGQTLRFQGIIDADGDGFAEFDAGEVDSPGVWQTAGPIPGSYLIPGVYTVTYTARGCVDQLTECTFDVIITSGNPILACQNDMILINDVDQCTATVTGLTPLQGIGCNTLINYEIVFPVASGLATVSTTSTMVGTHNDASGTTFPLGISTITYTMEIDINGDGDFDDTVDGFDETQTCAFTVEIIDEQTPTAFCVDIETTLDEDGEVVVFAANPNDGSTFVDGGSTDNCAIASILIAKPNGAFGASVTFDCDDLGTNFVNLQVTDESGNVSNCIAQITVNHFLSNYNIELDLAEICIGDNTLTQLDFSEYLTITDENGNFINPDALPADLRGTWSISNSNMFPNSFPGTIDQTSGQYTIGTGNGNVLVQYSLALSTGNNPGDITACSHDTESIFELYQPLDMGIPSCFCAEDGVKSFRVVDLGIVEGGLPPYTIQFEGAGLDIDEDGTPDALFNLGEFTYEYNLDAATFFSIDLGQLLINDGETNWSITVLDSRGCEIARQGQCEPLLEVPSFIGANSPACFTDGSYSLSLSNSFDIDANYTDGNADNGDIRIEKLIDGKVSDFQINNGELCGNFPNFNADAILVNVFTRDVANDRIIVNPEALVGLDARFAGTYRVTLRIPPSEATQCQFIEVSEVITLYPSFDPCFAMPLELCGNAEPIRIDVNETNPGYDDLADNLLCRDLNEMSVWELIAPNGVVIGTGTTTTLIQENDTNTTGQNILEGTDDGDVIIDPTILFATFGPGTFTLNHEIGIDICKSSCTFSFDLLDFPIATTSTNMPNVCCEDDLSLVLDGITGGTAPFMYDWSFVDATMTAVPISQTFTSEGALNEFMLPVSDLPGGCPMFDANPNTVTQDRVYSFILTVVDANGCANADTVMVAINPNPSMDPEVFNAIYCQTNSAVGESPIKNIAFSTSTLRVSCGESFDNVDANGNGFIDQGTCSDIAIIGDSDGDGIPDVADADLNLPDADGDGIPDSADTDLLCMDADGDGIPDVADMDVKTTSMDTDCDGIPDEADTDADKDGVLDVNFDTDQDGIENTADVDADGNGNIDANDDDGNNIPNSCDADDNLLNNMIPTGGPDFDGDGVPDLCDVDRDNDAIFNAADASDVDAFNNKQVVDFAPGVIYEGPLDLEFDADGDGIENPADINSFPLGTADTDGDGIADVADSDVDGDFICNVADVEFNFADTDGDGFPDNVDADIDNDGILDNGGDVDNDGIANIADADHPSNAGQLDTDSDNIIDAFDADDDNDGVIDTCDAAPLDVTNATILLACDCGDLDMDHVLDNFDIDDDNDGILDEADADHPYNVNEPDTDGNGIIDALDRDANGDEVADTPDVDTDNDNIIDAYDTDDDNDGILDEGDADAGGDGVIDFNKLDSDGDGIADSCDTDDDGDGIADECDADSNGDNEPDCLFPFTDVDGNGVNDFGDPDGDGIYTGTIDGKTTTCDLDSDNDGIVDYADSDIDGDGVIDNGPDANANGVNDACDLDIDGDGITNACDADSNPADPDSDGDGIIDTCDCDDDNDGIFDTCDAGGFDTDLDGILDAIDADIHGNDTDGDGITDAADSDVDGDGIPNAADADFTGSDNDGDGINDAGDIDDDNDGIFDAADHNSTFAYNHTDADNDEIKDAADVDVTSGVDANGNGIDDAFEAVNLNDFDGDGIDDTVFLSEDSNRDGIIDGSTNPNDSDDDGILNACDVDVDNDGINDTCDIDQNPGAGDADGDGIIDACDVLVFPTPTAKWFASETSTEQLFDFDSDKDGIPDSDVDGDGSTFDPVLAGLVDPNTPGDYTFYVECFCVPGMKCASARVPATLTILDCQAEEGECTYLLVLQDFGADGWDGASIDVTVDENPPATNYKLTAEDCDLKIIPISTKDGAFIDLKYWSGAKENEHGWFLIAPDGSIALDDTGAEAGFNAFPSDNVNIRVQLDCPTVCEDVQDYYIVNTIGNSPGGQLWELRDESGTVILANDLNEYAGLPLGSTVIDTIQLSTCSNYSFNTYDATGNIWDAAMWQIIGSDASRGTSISSGQFAGLFEIISGPQGQFIVEQNCAFTIPCPPEDCPVDQTELSTNMTDCELAGYVHPSPPTPFICYPNSTQAFSTPLVTLSYPELGVDRVPTNTAVDLPVGTNTAVFEVTYLDGQIVRCTSEVFVVTDNSPAFSCNDHLNVPLGNDVLNAAGDCFRTITPDELIENTIPCEDQFEVIIYDTFGQSLTPPNMVGPDQIGLTLNYKVEHIGSGVSCWGTITVEDKIAPFIECTDYDISCAHPNLMDENYVHTESFNATELPAIIGAEGSFIETNIEVECPLDGEVITNVDVVVANNHTRLSDLSLTITSPDNQVVTTSIPVNPDDLAVFNDVTYNSLLGEWGITIVDNNGTEVDGNLGGLGIIEDVELRLTAGFPSPVLVLDCGEVTFSVISEFIDDTNCNQAEGFGARLLRTWQAIDQSGNASNCTQQIGLKVPTLADLDLPGDVEFECETVPSNPAEITTELAGEPTFGCFPIDSTFYNSCDFSITFEDDVKLICGNSFVITRTWTLTNWCAGIFNSHVQKILVSDTEGPAVNTVNIQYGTGANDCDSGVVFLSPAIVDNCSGVQSIIATYNVGGGLYDQAGSLTIVDITNGASIDDLPFGMSQVQVEATDACDNKTVSIVNVNVFDSSAPTAICNDNLHISLNSAGEAFLFAIDLDEGSSDNCGIASIQARRVSGCIDTTAWASSIPFECCDVDQMITVELLVTDISGNTNTCWNTVLIEDPIGPQIDCADDVTLTCDDALHAEDSFIAPTATDNCDVSIEAGDITSTDLPNCGQLLTQSFTATDGSDKSDDASCMQTVTVVHVSDFIVRFPADELFVDCALEDIEGVTVTEDDCENIGISVEDRVFVQVEDACYKIERTYTVINHCIVDDPSVGGFTALGTPLPVPNTFRDDDGFFQFTQIIKVMDNEAPTVMFTAPDPCDFTEGCEGPLVLTATAEDACSDIAAVELTYQIDLDSDGTFDISDSGSDASGIFPYGDHIIKWTATDGCGNFTAEEFEFSIEDCKNPTPVCQGLTTVVMNNGECVSIWALDLLEYAEDNCTERTTEEWDDNARIRRAGSTGALTTALDVCCDDVQNGGVEVEVWIEDDAGNADFCIVLVEIQDNGGNCPDDGVGASARISGTTATEFNTLVDEVQVMINNDVVMTNVDGIYTKLEAVDKMYEVIPVKLDGVIKGISTFDLVLLAQHILRINELDSPYQLIAADVNGDSEVDIFDMVELRQLILFQVTEFSNNTSWRFVDADYVFQNPTAPWNEDYPQTIMVELGNTSMLNEDFIAVKIGDLDGDAKANFGSSILEQRSGPSPMQIQIDDADLKAGNEYKVDFRASDFTEITGYQFTLDFDQTVLDFVSVDGGVLDINENNFGMRFMDQGILTTSFAEMGSAISRVDDEILFSITFAAKTDGRLQDAISISDKYLNAEAYNAEGKYADVQLTFRNEESSISAEEQFELFQNIPNPFNTSTAIGFNLPERTEASIIVYDLTGKVVYTISDTYARGYNEVELERQLFTSSGTFIYQFRSAKYTAERKIVVID